MSRRRKRSVSYRVRRMERRFGAELRKVKALCARMARHNRIRGWSDQSRVATRARTREHHHLGHDCRSRASHVEH